MAVEKELLVLYTGLVIVTSIELCGLWVVKAHSVVKILNPLEASEVNVRCSRAVLQDCVSVNVYGVYGHIFVIFVELLFEERGRSLDIANDDFLSRIFFI